MSRALIQDFTGLKIKCDKVISTSMTNITALTDNTGASANNTIENVPAATAASTDTSAASLASTNAALTAIENNIADLAAKVNAILAANKV